MPKVPREERQEDVLQGQAGGLCAAAQGASRATIERAQRELAGFDAGSDERGVTVPYDASDRAPDARLTLGYLTYVQLYGILRGAGTSAARPSSINTPVRPFLT